MPWVKIDDKWSNHPKIVTVGPLGKALYMDGLCYASQYLTDGFIPYMVAEGFSHQFQDLMELGGIENTGKPLEWLLAQGLWTEDEVRRGYWIHDYLDFNPSKAKVVAERDAAKERMRGARENEPRSSEDVLANNSGSSENVRQNFERSSPYPVPVKQPVKTPVPVVPDEPNGSEELEHSTRAPAREKKPNLAGFAEFWAIYPRRVSRADAERAWSKLKPDERQAAIDAIAVQIRWPCFAQAPDDKRPHASTWLAGRRWEDEPPQIRLTSNGRASPNGKSHDESWAEVDRIRESTQQGGGTVIEASYRTGD